MSREQLGEAELAAADGDALAVLLFLEKCVCDAQQRR